MRDQSINTFHKGMQKDLGKTMPQDGFYTHAENIRITTSGGSGESAIVVNVKGNKNVLDLKYTPKITTYVTGSDGITRAITVDGPTVDCTVIGYTVIRDTLITFSKGYVDWDVIHTVDLNTFESKVIYDNQDLNFSKNSTITAVGRYESDQIQRVYFTDNIHPVRSFNIKDPNLDTLSVDQLSLNPPINFGAPRITAVETLGVLPAGMYQYAYRLKTNDGKSTRFSPLSNFVHIVSGEAYWEYEPDPEAQTEYNGTEPGEQTNKSVLIKLTNLDTNYDEVELVALHRTSLVGINSAYIVDKVSVSPGDVFIQHLNSEGAALISEEITAITNIPSKVKTLTTKDNRLFMSNLTYTPFDLQFNARAYRFKRSDSIIYPRLSITETPGTSNTMETYVDFDFDVINQDNYSKFSLQQNIDAINPYNLEGAEEPNPDNAYKFTRNGKTLGGEGPNVSYKFIKKRYDGNTLSSIPGTAPFVKARFATDTVYDTSYVSEGDYKSPIVATEMVGYRRNEIYRFGVVLYDLQGNPGFVNWIGDIKFPDYKDFDWESSSGIYNFTLSQNHDVQSGTNYHFNTGDVDAYSNIDKTEDDSFQETLSNFDSSSPNSFRATSNHLYALGIQFIVNIPEEIQDKISGYRVVRLERTEGDKTVVGSGALNYLHNFTSLADTEDEQYLAFGYGDNEKKYGGLSHSNQNNYDKHHPMGYYVGSKYLTPYIFSIDSPDFSFGNYPSLTDDAYVSIDGAFIGNFKYGHISDIRSSSAVYTTHKLANSKEDLHYTFPLTYMSKLSKYDKYKTVTGLVEELGVFNYTASPDIDTRWTCANNDTLLCGIADQNPDLPFEPGKTEISLEKGIDFSKYITNFRASGGRGKLFATIKKDLKGTQYGGNTEASRSTNTYIPAGPFISMEGSEYLGQYNEHQVWGGDTYLVMYDLQKGKKYLDSDLGVGGEASSTYMPTQSFNMVFPVESSYNITLRSGIHFANRETADWQDDTDNPFDEFELNSVYSSSNNTEVFIPKPLNFIESSSYDNRIIYSDAKINNATSDSWTKFEVENYRDLDGSKGAISTLVNFKDDLYFLQRNGFGALAISPTSTVIDESGTSIVLGTGDVIQDFQYISNTVGCIDSEAVISTERGIYWIDTNIKKIYAFRANGLESISDVHGMKTWAYNKINTDKNILIGKDILHNEILFSIEDEKTLVFNEDLNKFTSFYDFSPEIFINTQTNLLSIKNSSLYVHNNGEYNKWYDEASNVIIEFVVNKNPLNSKVFDTIEWYMENAKGIELTEEDNFDHASFKISSPKFLIVKDLTDADSEFNVRENISRMPVPRLNDNVTRFRDTHMIVRLFTTGDRSTDKLMLHYVKTLFRISRR